MDLPLEGKLKVGVNTMHRRTEPAVGPWQPSIDELVAMVRQVDELVYDSLWRGDHTSLAFPFIVLFFSIQTAEVARHCLLLGQSFYLTPLLQPHSIANQVHQNNH